MREESCQLEKSGGHNSSTGSRSAEFDKLNQPDQRRIVSWLGQRKIERKKGASQWPIGRKRRPIGNLRLFLLGCCAAKSAFAATGGQAELAPLSCHFGRQISLSLSLSQLVCATITELSSRRLAGETMIFRR